MKKVDRQQIDQIVSRLTSPIFEEVGEEMLIGEKEERGYRVVCVGISNIATLKWCSMKSILKSKNEEMWFFRTYVEDTLKYGLELGYISTESLKGLMEEMRAIEKGRAMGIHSWRLGWPSGFSEDGLVPNFYEIIYGPFGLLDIVENIIEKLTISDMEKLLSEREREVEEFKKHGRSVVMANVVRLRNNETGEYVEIPGREVVNPLTGEEEILLNPFVIPKSEIEDVRELVERAGKKVGRLEDYPPSLITNFYYFANKYAPRVVRKWKHWVKVETTRREIYPTVRWSSKWGDYIIIGMPDGITKDFIYVYKEYERGSPSPYQLEAELSRADLYGYFFKRKRKRVQVYIKQRDRLKIYDEPVDEKKAMEMLKKLEKIDEEIEIEEILPPKPAEWKCRKCEYRTSCPYFI